MLARIRFSWFLALAAASLASADPVVTAYTHRGDDLYLLELTGDDISILPQMAGSTGVHGVCALAAGPGDSFFAAASDPLQPDELWLIDRQALAAVAVGDLGVELDYFADLASDGGGGLWLAVGGTLHSVDTATGQAMAVGGASELAAIAFDGGTFYGITGSAMAGDWTLVTIDPATGDRTFVSALDLADDLGGIGLTGVHAMDFDDLGGLWVVAEYGTGIIDPPIILTEVDYFAEPLSGTATSRSSLPDHRLWKSLVVTGTTAPAVDVPALGAGGLAVLALMVSAAAALAMRRRRSGAADPR